MGEILNAGGQQTPDAFALRNFPVLRRSPLILYFFQQRFADNFEAEQVGILEMAYMTEERLQSLGIPLGPRLRIMEEVKKLSWHNP